MLQTGVQIQQNKDLQRRSLLLLNKEIQVRPEIAIKAVDSEEVIDFVEE